MDQDARSPSRFGVLLHLQNLHPLPLPPPSTLLMLTRLLLFPRTFPSLLPLYWLFIKRVHTICGIPLSLTRAQNLTPLTLLAFYYAPRFRACRTPRRAGPQAAGATGAHTHMSQITFTCACCAHVTFTRCMCAHVTFTCACAHVTFTFTMINVTIQIHICIFDRYYHYYCICI